MPYPALLALVVALPDTIPRIGATLASVAGALVALSQSMILAGGTLLFFIAYQAIENLIAPRIFARTVKLSPLAAFVAILIVGALAGVLGAVLAPLQRRRNPVPTGEARTGRPPRPAANEPPCQRVSVARHRHDLLGRTTGSLFNAP